MYKTNQEQEGPGAPGAPKIGGGKNLMVHYKNVLTKFGIFFYIILELVENSTHCYVPAQAYLIHLQIPVSTFSNVLFQIPVFTYCTVPDTSIHILYCSRSRSKIGSPHLPYLLQHIYYMQHISSFTEHVSVNSHNKYVKIYSHGLLSVC